MKNGFFKILQTILLTFLCSVSVAKECVNNKAEVLSSEPIMKKIKELGGSVETIFTTWIDKNKATKDLGVRIVLSEDGQYAVYVSGQTEPVQKDFAQICLEDDKLQLALTSSKITIKLPNLKRIRLNPGTGDSYATDNEVESVEKDGVKILDLQPETVEQ